jgi:hypothetical protein
MKDHVHNCAPCHLPNVDGQIDPSLAVIPVGLQCMLCELPLCWFVINFQEEGTWHV